MLEIPDTPDAHRLKAIELRKTGKLDEALKHILRALELRPDYPAGYYNLAGIRLDQGYPAEAETAWRKAIQLKPGYFQAHSALSAALRRQGKHSEAIAEARKGVELAPDNADARFSLATALFIARQFTEAEKEFQACLKIKPDSVLALNNYANLLADTDRPAQATLLYRKAIKLDPDQVEILANLANVLKAQAHIDEALACIRKTLRRNPLLWSIHSNLLLTLNCAPMADGTLLNEHRDWARRHADRFAPATPQLPHDRSPDRKLRIGYVSSDFRRHSVSYFIEPILREHDRSQVEIYCYSNAEFTDDTTDRLRGLANHWRPIFGVADSAVVQMIQEDRIDILVDLNGHTANHRLLVFARKPAPVQVTYLGYPNTSGLKTIDYRLTDDLADPPGISDAHCIEALIRLPRGAWCYQPPAQAPAPRVNPGPSGRPIVFGSFNNFAKVSLPTFQMWVKVLQQAPNSTLLVKAECMSDPDMRQKVRNEFIMMDVDPSRVELIGKEPSFLKHLGLYHRMDIALDTFPYNGTTTTCEAMWMGVPVVTLAGKAHVSRVGASLLHRMDLDSLVANTPDEFAAIAAGLAGDAWKRNAISGMKLRERMSASPLMDAQGFAQQLEQAYREMWQKWCATSPALP